MNSSRSSLRIWWRLLLIWASAVGGWSAPASAVILTEQEIDVIPISLTFGSTQLGSSTSGSFAIINSGQQDLVVSGIEVTSGSDFSVEFGVAAQYCTSSTPVIAGFGERCAVRVRFTPTAVGVSTGEVTISSNDSDEPIVTVTLRGTGVAPPEPEIHVDPVYIDFMSVAVGSSETREITISNTGPDPLLLGPGMLSSWVDFSVDDYGGSAPCGLAGVVPTGGSCTITVTFSPTTPDPAAAILTLSSNDPDDPTVDVALFGNRTDTGEDCSNGIDDDGDGFVDCRDYEDCGEADVCREHPCWAVEVIDVGGQCTDIALDGDDSVHLVYLAPGIGGSGWILRHAMGDPEDVGGWIFEDVDTASVSGGDCALTLGEDGSAHVAYVADDELRYATDASGDWASWMVEEDVDANVSIALDSSGLPHMAFRVHREREVSPGVFEREYSPFYARQLAPGGDFETYNPAFRLFADESGGLTPFRLRDWYAEVDRIVLDASDYPLVLFSDSAPESSALGRIPNWGEGIAMPSSALFGRPVDLALGASDRIHAAGVVPERDVVGDGTVTLNQLVYATHPGGGFPAAPGWTYHPVDVVLVNSWGPVEEVNASLALDSDGNAHFAFNEVGRSGDVYYSKVVLDGDAVANQVTELVHRPIHPLDGQSAEIAIDSAGQAHIAYFEDDGVSEPDVRYARQIECPGPMPSISPVRSIFYLRPQSQTFYVTNIGVGDLEIDSLAITPGNERVREGDWYLEDCAEDHALDFMEGADPEPTLAEFYPPVVLAEGESGVVCVGFEPERIRYNMGARLTVESSAGTTWSTLSAGADQSPSDGCDNCDGCAMSDPEGGVPIPTLLGLSMFAFAVLLWRKARLRG